MEISLYKKLYENRLLENNEQILLFEEALNELACNFGDDDIVELCQVFDDNTMNDEVMFGAIHLLETLSSESAFINTIIGIAKMNIAGHRWAKIIIYRCLNDDYSIEMINRILPNIENESRAVFFNLLDEILKEDAQRFGAAIKKVVSNIV